MEVVLVDSNPHDSYNTVEQMDEYLAAAIHAGTDWSGASDAVKAQAAVTATRLFDRQRWKSGYTTQAERFAVQAIRDAHIEAGLALVQGGGLQSDQSTAQQLQSIKAGSVALTYFRGAEGQPLRFPLIVWELLRDYLAGADLAVLATATGTDGVSVTSRDLGFTRGI